MKSFKIGNYEIQVPIIQGGMGVGISLASLAAAVANEGGIGVISTVGIGVIGDVPVSNYKKQNIEALRVEIKKARALTNGILGVNIMVALTNYDDMVKTSIEEGIDIIFSGAGLPLDQPKYLNGNTKTLLVPIVSSGKAAKVICSKWKNNYDYLPSAIVVEGPKAGGHLGFKPENIFDENYKLEKLVPEVVEAVKVFESQYNVKIPVIAGGGIYTGKDIFDIIKLGASGVQMGTRFIGTKECDASDEFKNKFLKATKDDIVIINSPVGMPGRAIKNKFLDDVKDGLTQPKSCPFNCIITCNYKVAPYCIAKALIRAQMGQVESGFTFSGENGYRINEIISVKELFSILHKEFNEAEKA